MKLLMIFSLLILGACKQNLKIIPMPNPVSNNAVALTKSNNSLKLYSFNGLSEGKSWNDIHNESYQYADNKWQQIKSAKNSQPVLASTAVNIGKIIYVIGGYTVDEKHNEKSMAEIYRLDTQTNTWSEETKMPTPVDDTVALVYAERYIYLVSGWFDVDNVSDVQVYDTKDKKWFNATEFPAPAVFGHAGGIVDNQMLICDGVKVLKFEEKKQFVASPICASGTINKQNPKSIEWKIVQHHSQTAFYRMASVGDFVNNRVIFAGGSDNPYNYDGTGYNGKPSKASNLVFSYDFTEQSWNQFQLNLPHTMDHRGLLFDGDWFYIIGGMSLQQKVSNQVLQFKLKK